MVFFSFASSSFLTFGNLQNILQQVSMTGIIAVGLTFVILTAEIDLSVASVANATGIVVAFFTLQDASVNIANVAAARRRRHHPGASSTCLALGGITAFGVTGSAFPPSS